MNLPALAARRPHLRLEHALAVGIAVMLAYVLYHDERFLIDPTDPNWPHYHEIGQWLLPHGVLGALALILSFMQFNATLRARHPLVHRVSGRLYVMLVAVVAPLGIWLGYLDRSIGYSTSFIVATYVLAILWMGATGLAFYFIRRRLIEQHRRWMTRSLSMALVFLTSRVTAGLIGWDVSPENDTIVVWVCVAAGYPLADLALQLGERRSLQARARGAVV